MLEQADAAILIGDPALLALEHRASHRTAGRPLRMVRPRPRVAHPHRTPLGSRSSAGPSTPKPSNPPTSQQPNSPPTSKPPATTGLAHIDDLVREWTPRIDVPPTTIRNYLTRNIHYTLDDSCIRTILLFRQYAAEVDVLPPLPSLNFL